MPYRVTIADGARQSGDTAAELRVQSRWWITRRTKERPKLETAGPGAGGRPDDPGVADIIPTDRPTGVPEDLFKRARPPEGWQDAVCGESLPLDDLGAMPSPGSSALAATRVESPGDRRAVIGVRHKLAARGHNRPPPRFLVRVWLNGEIVYTARHGGRSNRKDRNGEKDRRSRRPFALRKGENTMLVECRSEEDVPAKPGSIAVQFDDAGKGGRLSDLLFDIDKR